MLIKLNKEGVICCECNGRLTIVFLKAITVIVCRECKRRIRFNKNASELTFALFSGGKEGGGNGETK